MSATALFQPESWTRCGRLSGGANFISIVEMEDGTRKAKAGKSTMRVGPTVRLSSTSTTTVGWIFTRRAGSSVATETNPTAETASGWLSCHSPLAVQPRLQLQDRLTNPLGN